MILPGWTVTVVPLPQTSKAKSQCYSSTDCYNTNLKPYKNHIKTHKILKRSESFVDSDNVDIPLTYSKISF